MAKKAWLSVALLISILASVVGAEELVGKIIQDNTGAPVVSADVRVYKIGVRGLAADLETDGEGRFAAAELATGDYRLEVEKPSYMNAACTFTIGPGTATRLTIRLVRLGTISGRVRSANGQPVSSAVVQVFTKTPGGMRPMSRVQGHSSNLDESGGYRLFNLVPGEYAVAVSFGAFTAAVSRTGEVPPNSSVGSGFQFYPNNSRPEIVTISGGEELRNIDLTISAGTTFSVSGKLELPAPKTAFWVTLTAIEQPSLAIAVTPANDDGAFRLEGIPAGSYYLFAGGPVRGRSVMGATLDKDPLYARSRIEVNRDISDISLTPQKGHSTPVRMKVEAGSEGTCPTAASVIVTNLEDWGAMLQRTATAGRDKDTPIRSLAPSNYQLTALDLGENCYQTSDVFVDLTAGDHAAIVIPLASAGSIHGNISGAKDGDLSVVLLSSFGREIRSTVPDPDGHFSFAALAPGQYRIAAYWSSESSQTRWMGDSKRMTEIEVRPGKITELELRPPQPSSSRQ